MKSMEFFIPSAKSFGFALL